MLSKTVLIIDDEIDSCLLLKSFLSQLHFQVFTAFTLKDGMKLIDDISPSVIFLDNNLPDGFGWDHIDHIREKAPSASINLVSAYYYDIGKLNGKKVTVFAKPLSLSSLRNHLV